jgi:hypothetical protein
MSLTLLPGADRALLRWKVGHHLFHLQLGAMNTLLAAARELLESASWPELADTFDRLSVLYDGATATMRYAADFSPDVYEQLIRPSMAPPYTSPGFSGTLNREHALMLDQLRELRGQFKAIERSGSAPGAACDAATRLWRAQSRNRRHHILVCQRFVPNGESLLKAYWQANPLPAATSDESSGQEERETSG